MSRPPEVHPTAQIDPGTQLAAGVQVGPFCVLGDRVEIGEGTRIGPHTVIQGPCKIGRDNHIYGQSAIGVDPQDLKYRGEKSLLRIGDGNRIREFVTIHRGTEVAGNETLLGSGNLLMTGVHVAHDCRVGDSNILANQATLAGHVIVGDHTVIGAFCGVQQFCRVGHRAFIGGYSVITRDALPFIKTVGTRSQAKIYGINTIGLERADFGADRIQALRRAYRILFRQGLTLRDAIARVRECDSDNADLEVLIRFIETAENGFVR